VINVLALAGNGGNAARWSRLPQPLDDDPTNPVHLHPISLPGFDGIPLAKQSPSVHDFADWLTAEASTIDGPRVFFGTGIGGSIGLQAAQAAGLADAGRFILKRRWKDSMPAADVDRFAQGYLDCAAFEVMWDILDAQWFDALQPIPAPSILMWGANDAVLGSNLAAGFDRVLPTAEVVIKDSWGHYPMLETPQDFASTISALSRQLLA